MEFIFKKSVDFLGDILYNNKCQGEIKQNLPKKFLKKSKKSVDKHHKVCYNKGNKER